MNIQHIMYLQILILKIESFCKPRDNEHKPLPAYWKYFRNPKAFICFCKNNEQTTLLSQYTNCRNPKYWPHNTLCRYEIILNENIAHIKTYLIKTKYLSCYWNQHTLWAHAKSFCKAQTLNTQNNFYLQKSFWKVRDKAFIENIQ